MVNCEQAPGGQFTTHNTTHNFFRLTPPFSSVDTGPYPRTCPAERRSHVLRRRQESLDERAARGFRRREDPRFLARLSLRLGHVRGSACLQDEERLGGLPPGRAHQAPLRLLQG